MHKIVYALHLCRQTALELPNKRLFKDTILNFDSCYMICCKQLFIPWSLSLTEFLQHHQTKHFISAPVHKVAIWKQHTRSQGLPLSSSCYYWSPLFCAGKIPSLTAIHHKHEGCFRCLASCIPRLGHCFSWKQSAGANLWHQQGQSSKGS